MSSKESAARRNRALRKIRACRTVPLETRAVLETIIDLVDRPSGYTIAWPTARTIGIRIGRSARTVRWHVRAIRATRIFDVKYLTPEDAVAWCQQFHGFTPKLDRVRRQAPPLYVVNPEHWIWSTKRLTPDQDKELGEVVNRVLALRNRHKPKRARATASKERQPAVSAAHAFLDLETVRRHLLATRIAPESVIDVPIECEDWLDAVEWEGLEPLSSPTGK